MPPASPCRKRKVCLNTDHTVNTERVNTISFENGTVNRLTPLTDAAPRIDDIPLYPTEPCQCGSINYLLSGQNQWLCSRCHPENLPTEEDCKK